MHTCIPVCAQHTHTHTYKGVAPSDDDNSAGRNGAGSSRAPEPALLGGQSGESSGNWAMPFVAFTVRSVQVGRSRRTFLFKRAPFLAAVVMAKNSGDWVVLC
jgi:hypothetical protein